MFDSLVRWRLLRGRGVNLGCHLELRYHLRKRDHVCHSSFGVAHKSQKDRIANSNRIFEILLVHTGSHQLKP